MLAETAMVLWRRRVLVLLSAVIAIAVGAAAFVSISPTQKCSAEVLIIGATHQPGVDGPVNPFANLSSSLAVTASIVSVVVSDDRTAQQLSSAGYTALYTVAPNTALNAGPTLLVTAEAKSGAVARSTLDAVLRQISTTLEKLQSDRNIASNLYVQDITLTSSLSPVPQRKAQIQASAGATGGVLLVLLVLILLIERRRTPKVARHASVPPSGPEGSAPPSETTPPPAESFTSTAASESVTASTAAPSESTATGTAPQPTAEARQSSRRSIGISADERRELLRESRRRAARRSPGQP